MIKLLNRLCAILVCTMITISSVCFASADTEILSNSYKNAIDELKQIGLDNIGFTLSENKPITRGEFIALVMNVEYDNVDHDVMTEKIFDDVSISNPYAWAVSAAVKRGIINGSGDGLFQPDMPITYDSAAKILVSILGYGLRAEANGGFPAGYIRQAKVIDIEPEYIKNADSLTYGEAAYMVLQAVNTEIMAPSGFGTSVTYEVKKDITWLKNSRDIVRYEGVMQANEFSSLYSNDELSTGEVIIDGEKYKTKSDISSYLGYNLYYYVKSDDTVIYAYPQNNDITTVNADDVSYTDGRIIKYYENDREKSIYLPKDVAVIYNNTAYPNYELKSFKIKSGYIEFIKIDGVIQTAKIFEMRPAYVAAIDVDGEIIYDAINKDSINYGEYKNFKLYDENGDTYDIKKIATGDVLNMYISKKADYAVIYKSTQKAEGTVTSIRNENGLPALSVDGVEYKISKAGSIDASSINTGDKIKIYLDFNGDAVYAEQGARDASRYAYLVSISAFGGLEKSFSFKLYDSDGEVKTFDAVKEFKVNDKKIKQVSDLPSGLENGGAVLYEVNSDGLLTRLYTPDAAGSPLITLADTKLRRFYPRETGYVFAPESENAMSQSFCVDKNTLMLCIPENAKTAASKRFSIADPTSFPLYEEHTLSAYTKNTENNVAEFVLEVAVSGTGTVNTQKEAYIVTDVNEALNSDGDEVYSITFSGKSIKNKEYKTVDKTIGSDVEIGDIVIFNLNSQSEITEMRMIVDLNKTDADGNTTHNVISSGAGVYYNTCWHAGLALFEGYPYSVKNKIVRFAEKGTDPDLIGDAGDTIYFDSKNTAVFEIDTKAKKKDQIVTERTIASFAGYKENGLTENCLLYIKQGTPMWIIIYK